MTRVVMVIPRKIGEVCAISGKPGWSAPVCDQSLLAPDASGLGAQLARMRETDKRLIVWSGSFAEVEGGGRFDDDPRTWGPKGWEAMEKACGALGGDGNRVLIRPHARHVVSDVPGCKRLLESEWVKKAGIGLAYDPASMCTAAMVTGGRVEDHFRRMYEAIELLPTGLAGVVMAGVRVDDRGEATLVRLGDAPVIGNLVASLAAEHVPEGVPLLVLDGSDAAMLA